MLKNRKNKLLIKLWWKVKKEIEFWPYNLLKCVFLQGGTRPNYHKLLINGTILLLQNTSTCYLKQWASTHSHSPVPIHGIGTGLLREKNHYLHFFLFNYYLIFQEIFFCKTTGFSQPHSASTPFGQFPQIKNFFFILTTLFWIFIFCKTPTDIYFLNEILCRTILFWKLDFPKSRK